MRRAARTDANQAEIVSALRAIGATVLPLHAVGQGAPDLAVGFRGVNWFIEVKRPPGPRGGVSDRGLTPAQERWVQAWAGQVDVVDSPEAALGLVGGWAARLADEVL